MFPVLSKVISATAATTREQAEHEACSSSCANPPALAPPLALASPHSCAAAPTQRLPKKPLTVLVPKIPSKETPFTWQTLSKSY